MRNGTKKITLLISIFCLLLSNSQEAKSSSPTISFVSITGSTSTITPGQRAVFTVVLSSTNGVGSAYVRFDSPSGAQAVGYGSRTSGSPGGQETWTMNVDFPTTAEAGTWSGVAYAASVEKLVISSSVSNMTVRGSAPAPTPTPTPSTPDNCVNADDVARTFDELHSRTDELSKKIKDPQLKLLLNKVKSVIDERQEPFLRSANLPCLLKYSFEASLAPSIAQLNLLEKMNSKMKTLICANKSTTKRITSLNPRCPKGFKKIKRIYN